MPRLIVLTGSSRGLGAAIAEQLLARGDHVIGIARKTNAGLPALAAAHGAWLEQWTHDLTDAAALAGRLQTWLAAADPARWQGVALINNAGVLPPLTSLANTAAVDIIPGIRAGLEAPLMLMAAFLAATRSWPINRRVLNISSGLGRRPMAGSVVYCAAKAGLDHATRALALEEATQPNGARVVSLGPGIIDTDMQTQLRAADPGHFPEHGRFVARKAAGVLASPAEAAAQILAYLDRADFGDDPIGSVGG